MVLVNDDASVRRLKGPGRPINPWRIGWRCWRPSRAWTGCSLRRGHPRELIGRLRPDVLVKGGDYRDITEIAGHDLVLASGGEVKLLGFVEGFSTSRIIDTIRNL